MIVDTSVWIDYINGASNWQTYHLYDAISTSSAVVLTPVIIQEVLQGLQNKNYQRIKTSLLSYRTVTVNPVDLAVHAAELYRNLRKKGVSVRKPNDCQIAYLAIYYNFPLLHRDRDFKHIAQHTKLIEVAEPQP